MKPLILAGLLTAFFLTANGDESLATKVYLTMNKVMKQDHIPGARLHEPPDFEPGARMLYNNSGYYLLA